MPKQRGKYKQYLWDNQKPIPKSTRHFKKKNVLENSSHEEPPRLDDLTFYDSNINQQHINDFCNDFQIPKDNNTTEEENASNDDNEEEINPSNKYNNAPNDEEYSMSDFIDALDSEITKIDLATAYLAAFFNGRTTQDSLTDFIKLSNITSQIKLPASFDGLKDLVVGKYNSLVYSKSWFCNTCIKPVDSPDNRFERKCPICKTR